MVTNCKFKVVVACMLFDTSRCDTYRCSVVTNCKIKVVRKSGKLPLWLSYAFSVIIITNVSSENVLVISIPLFTILWTAMIDFGTPKTKEKLFQPKSGGSMLWMHSACDG